MMGEKILSSKILGEGAPLVILHGLFGMSENWMTFAKDIAKQGYKVYLLDQRNHGNSFHSDIHDYDSMCEDLKKYIEYNNIDSTIVLGHSMGGKTAMKFSCKYPDKVDKLIVVDIAPKYYKPHHYDILKALNSLDLKNITRRKEAEDILLKKIDDINVVMFLLRNLYREGEEFKLKLNLKSITNNIENMGNSLDEHECFMGKTLFIKGEKSSYIQDNDETLLQSHFPNYTLLSINGAGHWVHAEKYDYFYKEVLNFIKKKK